MTQFSSQPGIGVLDVDAPQGVAARFAFAVLLVGAALACSMPEAHRAMAQLAASLFDLFLSSEERHVASELAGSVAARLLPAVVVAAAAVSRPGLTGPFTLFAAGLAGDVSSGGVIGLLALVMIVMCLAMIVARRALTGGSLIAGWARWAVVVAVLASCGSAMWCASWLDGLSGAVAFPVYITGGAMAGLFYPPVAFAVRVFVWLGGAERPVRD